MKIISCIYSNPSFHLILAFVEANPPPFFLGWSLGQHQSANAQESSVRILCHRIDKVGVRDRMYAMTKVAKSVQRNIRIAKWRAGGPAFNVAGQVVGIAFQSLHGDEAENIGYLIPTNVIQHFLTDYRYLTETKESVSTPFVCYLTEFPDISYMDLFSIVESAFCSSQAHERGPCSKNWTPWLDLTPFPLTPGVSLHGWSQKTHS